MAVKDYYVVLGVPRDESPGGIRAAFRDLARRHHPDVAGPEGAPAFRDVVEAYRVLSDPRERRRHDAELGGARIPVRRVRRAEPARAERLWRNLGGTRVPRSEHVEPLLCDVALTPAEAQRGGVLPIRLPTRRRCVACHSTGGSALFPCPRCDARGAVEEEVVVPVRIPPGVRPGARLDVPLSRWGLGNLWLEVRIGVG